MKFGGVSGVLLAMVGEGMGTVFQRAFQTNATCTPSNGEDWIWMDNAQHQSPCLTAAYTIGPCASLNYNVPALTGSDQYGPPANSTVNACICSWAVYNLLSACTLCQGHQSSIPSWTSWIQNCGGSVSSTRPYPENVTIPQDITFPNWAAQNPTSWPEQRFDGNAAKTYAVQRPGDWTDPSSPKASQSTKHGSNVGAIAGGVVGGVVVLAIGIAAALFLYCRNQKRKAQPGQEVPQMAQSPFDHHVRSPSDLSARTGLVYSPFSHASSPSDGSIARLLNSPTTLYTHNSSRNSFAQDSFMLSYAGTPPPQQGIPTPSNTFMTFNGAVSPFTLERPSSQSPPLSGHDRKRSEASTHMTEANGVSLASLNRSPMNPPAYTEAHNTRGDFSSQAPDQASTYGSSSSIITTPSTNPFRRPHEKSPSVGTVNSNEPTTGVIRTQGGSASLGGAMEFITRMNDTPDTSGAIPAYTGPGPSTAAPRDEKRRRPTITNQTPDEDAHQ